MVVQPLNKNNNLMKTIFRTIACLGVLVAAASCQLYEIDTQMTPEKAAASIRMVCDALPTYTVAATNPGTVNFKVSANTPWTITRSSGADWCTVTPSSSSAGALISDVVVSFENNNGLEDRSVTLTLTGEKVGQSVQVAITQQRKGRLFVTPVPQDYAASGGPLSFTIQTNMSWTVRASESWISFNRESGQPDPDGRTLTIIATAAPSSVMERTATITVSAGDDEESFDVTQVARFEFAAISESFPGSGGSQALKLRTDLPWEVSADKDWLVFNPESGNGDGSPTEIMVTAKPNSGTARTANVYIMAGGVVNEFEVLQEGAVFEIVPPASTEVPRNGGDLILEVNSSLDWTPSTEVAAWTVTKVDNAHLKVSAPYNDKFVARTGKVSIAGPSGAEDSIELTQDVNFTFEGSYEILSDGSVKLIGGAVSRLVSKDSYRYMTVNFQMGEVQFAEKGEIWFDGVIGNANLFNWLTVGKTRVRLEGTLADGKGARIDKDSYVSESYDISLDELNALKTYGIKMYKDAEDDSLFYMEFLYNGETRGIAHARNPFYYDTENGASFWLGNYDANATSDTWYVVKSCTVTDFE